MPALTQLYYKCLQAMIDSLLISYVEQMLAYYTRSIQNIQSFI